MPTMTKVTRATHYSQTIQCPYGRRKVGWLAPPRVAVSHSSSGRKGASSAATFAHILQNRQGILLAPQNLHIHFCGETVRPNQFKPHQRFPKPRHHTRMSLQTTTIIKSNPQTAITKSESRPAFLLTSCRITDSTEGPPLAGASVRPLHQSHRPQSTTCVSHAKLHAPHPRRDCSSAANQILRVQPTFRKNTHAAQQRARQYTVTYTRFQQKSSGASTQRWRPMYSVMSAITYPRA